MTSVRGMVLVALVAVALFAVPRVPPHPPYAPAHALNTLRRIPKSRGPESWTSTRTRRCVMIWSAIRP